MKNIDTILKEAGVEVSDEQAKAINEAMKENYKAINDYNNQLEKIKTLEGDLKAAQDGLEQFKDVKPEELTKTIEELKKTIEDNDAKYKQSIAERDFDDMLTESIRASKGINTKAIKALLDMDSLRASKNQKEDIADAIKALSEAEDSKMLFGASVVEDKVNPIGAVQTGAGAGLTGVEKAFFERTGVKA